MDETKKHVVTREAKSANVYGHLSGSLQFWARWRRFGCGAQSGHQYFHESFHVNVRFPARAVLLELFRHITKVTQSSVQNSFFFGPWSI